MAKQTNKTNHILNLLSGNSKKKDQNDDQELENAVPPVVPKGKEKEKEQEEQLDDSGHVEIENQTVIDVVDEKIEELENEELVNSINSALEDELKEYEEAKAAENATEDDVMFFGDELDEQDDDFGILMDHNESVLMGKSGKDAKPPVGIPPIELAAELEIDEPAAEAMEPAAEPAEIEEIELEPAAEPVVETEPTFAASSGGKMSQDEINQLLGNMTDEPAADEIAAELEIDEIAAELEIDEPAAEPEIDEPAEPAAEPAAEPIDETIEPAAESEHARELESELVEPAAELEPAMELDEPAEPAAEPVADEPAAVSVENKEQLSPNSNAEGEEPGYTTLNVMEKLVDMFALEYMEKFQICTCDRCVADVKALTLTKLAGKYIVVDKGAEQAMINFYEKKFKSDIIVELTKACMTIDENPHH